MHADIGTARTLLGNGKIIGITANTVDEALTACEQGADYLGIGTVFSTQTHVTSHPLFYDSSPSISKLTLPIQQDKHEECHRPRRAPARPGRPGREGPCPRAGRVHRGHQRLQYPAGAVPGQPNRKPPGRRRSGQRDCRCCGPGSRVTAAAGPGPRGPCARQAAEDGAVDGGEQGGAAEARPWGDQDVA